MPDTPEPKESLGLAKGDLVTPCLVLDLDILTRNLDAMQAHARAAGKHLRPHAKTHKCSELARRQEAAGAIGFCVAKVSEAERLLAAGLRGLLVTSPVVTPSKISCLLHCLAQDPDLMVVVDDVGNAESLSAASTARGLRLSVLVDVDPGMGRTGVGAGKALALGRAVAECDGLQLKGVQCYAGQVQHIPLFTERRAASLACLQEAAQVVHQFRDAGLGCEIFSGAGTGTYSIDTAIPELTELQVGSYALMDAEYLALGSETDPKRFADFPPALRLLTTVISANRSAFVTVDAGLKTLYHHGAKPEILAPPLPGFAYDWFGDEHGRIEGADAQARLPVGTVVELVVSHCDPTINLHDVLYVVQGDRVVDVWPVDLRGCSQ